MKGVIHWGTLGRFSGSLALLLSFLCPTQAQLLPNRDPVQRLLSSCRSHGPEVESAERVFLARTADGFVRYVGAPRDHDFPPPQGREGPPGAIASRFLQEHAELLAPLNPRLNYSLRKSKVQPGRHFEKFQQTYDGIPVFGTEITVQLNDTGGVESMLSDIARNFQLLEDGVVPVRPTLSAQEALDAAHLIYTAEVPGQILESTPPVLMIFDSGVTGQPGPMHLVWYFETSTPNGHPLHERTLIDAHSGLLVRRFPLIFEALNRNIYDAENSGSSTLIRSEGSPRVLLHADANLAYDVMGDSYEYYESHFSRDSLNNAGITLNVTVRYCPPGEDCPWPNARFKNSTRWISVGDWHALDDIMAHEYAHGVTLFEADLLYANESGAINESYSDIFGEFIDLANGRGNDSASVRWLIGEDFPGHIRNMADPPDRNHPDRKGSPLYVQPGTDPDDNGGVHKNSGINNKLCYLLTDGDTFNGQTVRGMGTNKVADLYYHALAYLLGPTSDFTDLYYTLRQAAANLNWSMADRNNVYRGCAAVEIAAPSILHVNWTGNPLLQNGSALLPYTSVIRAYNESWPGDELLIHDGSYRGNLFMEKEMLINSTVGADVIIRGQ